MSPRKRARPNPADGSSASQAATTTSQTPITGGSLREQGMATRREQSNTSTASADSSQRSLKQVHKARSWYGSWPRAPKSAASTQVARETILGDTSKPTSIPNFSRYDTKKSSDSVSVSDSTGPAASLPNIPENAPSTPMESAKVHDTLAVHSIRETSSQAIQSDATEIDRNLPELQPPPPPPPAPAESTEHPSTATGSGWLGWLNRSSVAESPPPSRLIEAPESPSDKDVQDTIQRPSTPQGQQTHTEVAQTPVSNQQASDGSSWFGFWSSTPQPAKAPEAVAEDAQAEPQLPKEPEDVVMQEAPPTSPPGRAEAGSTWAFWSRDTGTQSKGTAPKSQEEGQLAIMGEGSEAHPEPAGGVDIKDDAGKPPSVKDKPTKQVASQGKPSKKTKRLRPVSMDVDDPISPRPGTPTSEVSGKIDVAQETSKPQLAQTPSKQTTTNLLLPSFGKTYRMKENPSILRQITQILLRTQQAPAKHVFLTSEPVKIKKAIAIGVHGLFPAAYLRPMIGQPTGTSIKFANHCAEGIRRWADAHGCQDCEIEKVALEGEGKIGERVDNLWKLLLNWIEHIRNADLVIVACHSQGVPVGIMLVAKLIELGIISAPRIGVCAMGVSLGPFPDYRSGMGMLMGSAHELWEFANPESEISKRYRQSLHTVLDYGVRITYVASIDDQVVPLESAINSPVTHPYIYRAVFIDGRVHAPDFIAHLIGFACKLRNLGVSDHGLIRELSVPLAGSLYSGEGHSRLYDEEQVYDLAVTHALETTNVGRSPVEIRKHEGLTSANPYHLPWTMRGMLEEDFVKTELSAETAELLTQFDEWKPTTKALKDVKYRLEAVRSKL